MQSILGSVQLLNSQLLSINPFHARQVVFAHVARDVHPSGRLTCEINDTDSGRRIDSTNFWIGDVLNLRVQS